MKTCSRCKLEKELSEFSKRKRSKDGYQYECKSCAKENLLRARYGITPELYNEMWKEQQGRCAICGAHQVDFTRSLHVDHDHETGEIRGLLCIRCNNGLGLYFHDTDLLENAIAFLKGSLL